MDENIVAVLSEATTEDDFRVLLRGASREDMLEYLCLNVFQLRKMVNDSIPVLEQMGKNPMLKAFFPKVK